MESSESSNNSLLFIKYRKIDHGKSIDFFPIPILRGLVDTLIGVLEMNGLIFRDEYPQSL